MKKELNLSEIKKITFDLLNHFKLFCEENNITFYLSNGTLLGAVKYKGFIPWDDDIDVFVPRKDYDKLIKIYQDDEVYRLFCEERVAEYKFPFAKLCNMTTLKEEINKDNGVLLGVDIDIFPLDYCSEHILKPSVQRKIRINQIGCTLSNFTTSKGRSIHKRFIIDYCRLRGYKYFSKKLKNIINKERMIGKTHMGCLMWPVYGVREIVPSSVFCNTIEVEFEGGKFLAPSGFDIYLRSLYGDYEKDPPPEKQKTHHGFIAYYL